MHQAGLTQLSLSGCNVSVLTELIVLNVSPSLFKVSMLPTSTSAQLGGVCNLQCFGELGHESHSGDSAAGAE